MIGVIEDKAVANVPDGFHTGAIVAAEVTERQGYRYLDLTLTVADVATERNELAEVRAGYPLMSADGTISPSSMTGKMFVRFGIPVIPGKPVDEKMLISKPCQYVTVQKPGGQGRMYTNVDRDSLKPFQQNVVFSNPQTQAKLRG